MIAKLAAAAVAAFALTGAAHAAEVTRTGAPTAAIAATATVPAGFETVYLSGILPTLPAAPAAPGDAEAQAESVFSKIADALKTQGLTEGDVVKMTIFMWAPNGEKMDFAGMMKSYTKHYGTAAQPNKPTRSCIQVANLAAAGALLEVEVIAVRKPAPMPAKKK